MDDGLGGDLVPLTPESPKTIRTERLVEGLMSSRLYKFSYRVANENGWSELSDPVLIRAAVAPGKPPKPELVEATDTTIKLMFAKPEVNGGAEITGFKLFMNDGDSENEPTVEVASYTTNLLSHTLTQETDGLQTGLLYKFVFRATNAVGNSEDSEIAEFACIAPISKPGAPQIMLPFTSQQSVAVEWSQVGTNEPAGYRVFGYLLEMKDTADQYGTFEPVFDGSDLYPELKSA
jgi:hypothetical protein